ncbi:MAG: 50S ribosomal protein L11 methyltransferase [Lachnospiraceae bacterium]|nr:50S ribosomal protein L11 methyltransferase [Lachnospiraceae bacterium]
MGYIKYTINTTTKACEDICYELTTLGITAVEIIDNIPVDDVIQGKNYEELLPDMPKDNGKCIIHFYLEEEDEDLINNVKQSIVQVSTYMDVGEGTLKSEKLDNEDYLNNWKEYFHSFQVGDLLIKPTWEQLDAPKGVYKCISIDPGITFGTGAHETTKLCIEGLQKHLQRKDNVLDLGFGSGILSMVALIYGANHVTGTDIDPQCIEAAYENFDVNKIDKDKATFYIGDITGDKTLQDKVGVECYDIAVANILADIIINMSHVIYKAIKKGGLLISSGIIDFKEEEVEAALKSAGFKITEINHMGEWVNITAIKE